jgi:hypothetical protein
MARNDKVTVAGGLHGLGDGRSESLAYLNSRFPAFEVLAADIVSAYTLKVASEPLRAPNLAEPVVAQNMTISVGTQGLPCLWLIARDEHRVRGDLGHELSRCHPASGAEWPGRRVNMRPYIWHRMPHQVESHESDFDSNVAGHLS